MCILLCFYFVLHLCCKTLYRWTKIQGQETRSLREEVDKDLLREEVSTLQETSKGVWGLRSVCQIHCLDRSTSSLRHKLVGVSLCISQSLCIFEIFTNESFLWAWPRGLVVIWKDYWYHVKILVFIYFYAFLILNVSLNL